MRNGLLALWMLLCTIAPASAQVSFSIGLPGISIGVNMPTYPHLVPVPNYPVYYAPQASSNYFFYDGMYWVYQQDNWYASSWYNGPWGLVGPEFVPVYILRIPVRYYRQPPMYFHGWRSDAPPRWGEHWGNDWEQHRRGWDTWNRSAVPAPAPLPVYQRQYYGSRYPQIEQQQVLQSQHYRYQPQDAVVRQYYRAPPVQSAPASTSTQDQSRGPRPTAPQPSASPAPRAQPSQVGEVSPSRSSTGQATVQQTRPVVQQPVQQPPVQQPAHALSPREQQAPGSQGQARGRATAPAAADAPLAQQAPGSQPQPRQAPQAAAKREQQAPGSQGQARGKVQSPPAAEAPRQQSRAPVSQPQPQKPPQGASSHEQQPSRSHGQNREPQGKGQDQELKQGREKPS